MNKVYKVIWNTQLGCWQAVSELAKNHTSSSQSSDTNSKAHINIIKKVSRSILFGLALLPLSIYAAISNVELPTGAQINSGSASFIADIGTNKLDITQNSQNLSTNWNTFNIGQDATVNFIQPNKSSVAINHVIDSNASQIMGRLNANGQVFLLNPNGVVFSPTAQVNVGGIVASTLNLNDAEIVNDTYILKGDPNSNAAIENSGSIVATGGTVALIAPNVKNSGTISTPDGITHLTSASQVTLALQNGSLTQYQVDQGVLQGLVENGGAIIADNGSVYLTAKAKDSLSKAVVNHSGIIEANRLTTNAKGEIILLGDMQSGETNVSGTLKAEGKNGADGGFIETSAAKVNIDQDIKVSTLSDSGKTGEWLIDPYNVVISNATGTGTGFTANQDDTVINATTLTNALATTGVTVSTGGIVVGTQEGNITVDADLAWASNSTLTLQADKNINLNKKITATNGGLTLNAANNISANEAINVGTFTLSRGNWLQNTPLLPSFYAKDFRLNGGSFIRALGGDGSATTPWKLTDSYGVQGMGTTLSGNFALANDIDASGTVNWNSGAGFNPIGTLGNEYTGIFEGFGYTISDLIINRPTTEYVGLFGRVRGGNAKIQNIGLINGNMSGLNFIGQLIGVLTEGAVVNNSFSTGLVTGAVNSQSVGGLVGQITFNGTINNSYSVAKVTGNSSQAVGGLVGYLLGSNEGKINNSYSSGTIVSNNSQSVGGLVGTGAGLITGSFWNKETSGQSVSAGGTGLTTAQMFDKNYFTGFDFSSVWSNGDNQTTPYLLNMANNQVFNKNDLPTGTISSTNRPALYTAILNVNQLQNMNQNLSGKYLLGNNIDASDTVSWNAGAGFNPIGTGTYNLENDISKAFIGNFDGLGYSINNLFINRSNNDYVGFFGYTGLNSQIKNIGVVNGNITGGKYVGGLVGLNLGSINSAYATGEVSATSSGGTAGGLVGKNKEITAKIENVYATNTVSSTQFAGGLVGYNNYGSITNAYAIGETSAQFAGGLVANNNGSIKNVYAIGLVDGSVGGGGVVALGSSGTTEYAYWNNETTGVVEGILSGTDNTTGLSTAEMKQGVKFAFIDADSYLGGKNTIWRIYDGQTTPLLRSFLSQATINATDKPVTYNGQIQSLDTANFAGLDNSKILSSKSSSKNVGNYDLSYYSNQQGYDLIGNTATLTINKANLNLNAVTDTRTYDGTNQSTGIVTNSGLQGTDTVTAQQEFDSRNAGNRTLSVTGVVVNDGNNGDNYNVVAGTASGLINKANLNLNAVTDTRTYDGTNQSTGIVTNSGLQGTDTVTAQQVFDSRNAGNRTLSVTGVVVNDGNNGDNYNVVTGAASGAIAKTQATVTANSLNSTYNGKDQTATGFTVTGLVNGETESVLTGVTASVTGKNAGSYTNTATGTDQNYNLTFVDGSLNIAKAQATITANSLNSTYNGKDQTVSGFSAIGLVNGESEAVLTGVTASVTGKNAGKYINTATGLDQNYDLTFVDGSLNIAKAQATITANSLNSTYNGKDQTATGFTATGLVNGETESVLTGVTASVTGKNAGSYTNTATGTDKNYDLNFKDGSLNIAKAKINQVNGITANNRVYDATSNATLNTTSAQFDGIVAGDQLTVSTATGTFADKNVGTAKQVAIRNISLTGADVANYELINNTAQTTADISKANINNISGITANSRIYDGLTNATLNTANAQFNGVYAGDQLTVASATGQFENAATGQTKTVVITGLSLGGIDAQNYNLVDTTALTQANINMLTPADYLQAIQFKRPSYLPKGNSSRNTAEIEVRQGGVNTSGIQTLAGEH